MRQSFHARSFAGQYTQPPRQILILLTQVENLPAGRLVLYVQYVILEVSRKSYKNLLLFQFLLQQDGPRAGFREKGSSFQESEDSAYLYLQLNISSRSSSGAELSINQMNSMRKTKQPYLRFSLGTDSMPQALMFLGAFCPAVVFKSLGFISRKEIY